MDGPPGRAAFFSERGPSAPERRPTGHLGVPGDAVNGWVGNCDASGPALDAFLDLPRRELDRALSDRGPDLALHVPLRLEAGDSPPLHLLLGVALHLAQSGLAGAHRRTRARAPRRDL